MLKKLAFSQKVLRALAGEKRAGIVAPLVIGGTIAGAGALAKKGLKKGHEDYLPGFAPGVAESRVEV